MQTSLLYNRAFLILATTLEQSTGFGGNKSRSAANALRAQHGLPADVNKGISGSTLALIHRLAPQPTTSANAGDFVVNILERKAFLEQNNVLAGNICLSNNGGGSLYFYALDPVATVSLTSGKKGYIAEEDDWYSEIGVALVSGQAKCLAGVQKSCLEIIDFAQNWAKADALKKNDLHQEQSMGRLILDCK